MLRPEWVLILATVLWGTSWLPLQAFAAQGIDGFPMVLASYGLIAVFVLPLLYWQRAGWWQQRWGVLGIVLFGGWANAALLSSLSLAEDLVRVMLLFYLAPVWGVLGGWLLLLAAAAAGCGWLLLRLRLAAASHATPPRPPRPLAPLYMRQCQYFSTKQHGTLGKVLPASPFRRDASIIPL